MEDGETGYELCEMTCGTETLTRNRRVFRIRADRSAPGRVRRLLADLLPPGAQLENALLAADELVTNAVMHGSRSKPIRVTIDSDGCRLRIEVVSRGRLEPHKGQTVGGYGMKIVERLSEAHGLEPTRDGVRAWCVLREEGP